MASIFFFLFSILLLDPFTTTTTTVTTNTTTTYPLSALSQPPPHKQAQLNSIIDAIIGATDFSSWAALLALADISTIPLSATQFLPFPSSASDNTLLPSHIVPRRLSFSELQLFPTGGRLPTLHPRTTLLINNNSAANFTINGSKLTKPDLYQNAIVSVHGIAGFREELRVSSVRSRRKHPRKMTPTVARPHPNFPGHSRPPMTVSAGVKEACLWGHVAVVMFLVLLVLHILELPNLAWLCSRF